VTHVALAEHPFIIGAVSIGEVCHRCESQVCHVAYQLPVFTLSATGTVPLNLLIS